MTVTPGADLGIRLDTGPLDTRLGLETWRILRKLPAGHGIRLLEEDLAMSDRKPTPGDADDQRGSEPDMSATDEFAKMRAVMRASEKHREGGVDPELEAADADPDPDG
jgi:hypothetical protein